MNRPPAPISAARSAAAQDARVGVLMLESRFPRPPGDLGHDDTFDGPVLRHVVTSASPARVVRDGAPGLLEPFVRGARDLEARGARIITTSCGFLAPFQTALASAVSVPVVTSALMQVAPMEAALATGRRCGVVTIAGTSLTREHLRAAGAAPDTPVETTEGAREMTRAILGDEERLDTDAARADVVDACCRLAARGDVGAIVLECTNMTPYAASAAGATGLPVATIVTLVDWMRAACAPRRYAPLR